MSWPVDTVPAVLVFAYGNPSRGDDALGPALIDRLERQLTPGMRAAAGGIECLTDFQLQIEHALDLVGRRLILFVDAHLDCPPPWQLSPLEPEADASYSTHAISPAAVLRVFMELHGRMPPPSFILGIRGERFALGDPLSNAAISHLDAALALVLALCRHPDESAWMTHCQSVRGGTGNSPGITRAACR